MSLSLPRAGVKGEVAAAVSFHGDGHARAFLSSLRRPVAHLRPGQSIKVFYPLAERGTVLRVRKDETGALIVTQPKTNVVILETTSDRRDVAVFLGRTVDPRNDDRLVNCYFSGQTKARPK